MASEMKIRITADASQATTTMKATQANINKITKDLPSLEKAYDADRSQDNLDKINSKLSNVIELINRAAKAIAMTDSTTTEAEVKSKLYAATIESLGREYKGLTSESLNYLKGLKENISIEEENIRLIQEKTRAQEQYNNSLKSIIRTNVTGSGEYNVMGLAYNIPETYAETYSKLLEEKDMQEKQALLDDWLAAKKAHEEAVTNVEKIAQDERFKLYKKSLKEKEAEEKAYYKSIEERVKNESESLDKAKAMVEAQNNIATSTKAAGTAAKTSSDYFKKLFDTTKNVLVFRAIMKVINSIAGLNNFLKDSVQVAAEAEQVFSKLNTVFGETSGAMSRAISLATKLGTATSTAASALSTVGDLLQAQGQTTLESLSTASEWVSQFQDIIAFKDINMSLEEFAQNFMSGAAGNLRNFRTFGSIVRESAVNAELAKKGLDKLTGSELELAKMTARAEMALEQQKNAIGATQREWDTMLSTNRRYEESLKSLKENMGNYLEPMTKWWVTLKTAIINAMNAQMEYDKMTGIMRSGTRLESSKPILDENLNFNIENWESFVQELEDINWQARQPDKRMNNVIAAAGKYGATEEYLDLALRAANSAFGVYYSDDEIKKIIEELTVINEGIEKNEKINAEKAENEVYLNSINSFLEKLQEIKIGDTSINFNGSDWYEAFYKEFESFFSGGTTNSTFKQALNNKDLFLWFDDSIKAAISDIENSTIPKLDELFGEMTNTELLEEQRDAFKTLYEIAYQTGYFTDKQLEEIYNKWEELGIEIDKIKEKENIQQQIEDMWKNLSDSLKDTYAPIGVFVDGIIGSVKGAIDGISKGEGFWGKLWGGISGVFSGNAKGTLESENLEKVLMNILSKTEAFQELMSMVDTYIIPVIDQFLKPLLPLIDYFGKILQNTLLSFLEWFWPIMQGIAIGLTYIMGGINAVSQLISDSIKSLIGNVVVMFYKVIDAILWGDQSAPSWARDWADIKVWDNFQNNLKGIEDAVNDIKNNTLSIDSNVEELNEDDYETYRRLLQAKEITDEQFKRLTHQDVYSTKTVGNGIEYTSGGKRSYVSINSLTVQVPAGMTLEEFLKNLGDYSNGNLPFGVNTISA